MTVVSTLARIAVGAIVPLMFASAATAQYVDHDAVKCEAVAKEEMKPQMELQKKLVSEGWKVRQVKNFNGCYEVYGFDTSGRRVEAFFHPKTFAKVGEVKQPE